MRELGDISKLARGMLVLPRRAAVAAALIAAAQWREPARAWCGDAYPPYAYSLPWFEFPVAGGTMRVVGDNRAEAKKKLSPLLVLPSPALTYEPLENLEALTISERRVAFATLDGAAGSVEELGQQAAAALAKLEAPRCHVLGHGLGAAAALALHAADPARVASLVLASPFSSLDDVEPAQRAAVGESPLPLLATTAAKGRACVDAELGALRPARLSQLAVQRALRDGALPAMEDLLRSASAAGAPVLVTRGGRADPSSEETARRVLQRVPTARLATFAQSGPLACVDDKAAYLETLLGWLDEVDGTTSRRAVDTLATPSLAGYR